MLAYNQYNGHQYQQINQAHIPQGMRQEIHQQQYRNNQFPTSNTTPPQNNMNKGNYNTQYQSTPSTQQPSPSPDNNQMNIQYRVDLQTKTGEIQPFRHQQNNEYQQSVDDSGLKTPPPSLNMSVQQQQNIGRQVQEQQYMSKQYSFQSSPLKGQQIPYEKQQQDQKQQIPQDNQGQQQQLIGDILRIPEYMQLENTVSQYIQQPQLDIQRIMERGEQQNEQYKQAIVSSIQTLRRHEKMNMSVLERRVNENELDIFPYDYEYLSVKYDVEEARKSIIQQQSKQDEKRRIIMKFMTQKRQQKKRSLSQSIQQIEDNNNSSIDSINNSNNNNNNSNRNYINAITELMFGVNPQDILRAEQVDNYQVGDGCIFQGELYLGQPNGIGKLIYKNGEIYQGEWRKGEREGYGTYYSNNGDILYQGEWKNNQYNGFGIQYNNNFQQNQKQEKNVNFNNFSNISELWKSYQGEFFAGKWNGLGQLAFSNHNTFYGNFLGGAPHGLGVYEKSGKIVTGIWQQHYLYKYL